MKYIEVKQLYKETVKAIRSDRNKWLQFLKSASWNFKYNFDDQILIYAQKPNATACAEMKEWNEKVMPRRWVNKDTKGIAINAKEGSQLPLRFVFDISDTHNYRNTEYKLWSAEEKYKTEIIEALEDRFGTINNKEDLGQAILESSYNMVTDNIQDYLVTIEKYKNNTPLKNMGTEEIKSILLVNVWASVTYMMMTRCGIDAEKYISKDEFANMRYFNNNNLITILGTATSEIAETGLREIATTIRNLRIEEKNQNRTFVEKENKEYSNNIENEKGGKNYDENRIHETGRLSDTKYNSERREDSKWKIRKNEVEFSKDIQESRIYNIENGQQIDTTLETSTGASNKYGTGNDRENDESRGNNRRIEDERPYEMDRVNEQLQDDSRRADSERNNLQLELLTEEEQKQKIAEVENTSVFSFTQEMIDNELQVGSHIVDGKFRIYEYLSQNHSSKDNANFLKKEYGEGGWSPNYFNLSESHNAKGILLTKGHEDNAPSLLLSWYDVEKRIRQLISDDRYLNEREKEEYIKWQEEKATNKEDTSELKVEKLDNSNDEFVYKLQDRVFIGANEYEIVNINDKKVTIADIKFPIFMQEFDFDVFDKRVKETPYNDHLKKKNRTDLEEQKKDDVDISKNVEIKEEKNISKVYETKEEKIIPKVKTRRKNKIEYFDLHPEIPLDQRNNYKIIDNQLGEGTPKEKFRRNVEAIKTLKKCESENRYATPEEQEIMSKYVGWGGLSEAFRNDLNNWSKEYEELKSLLTEKEYEEARKTTLTAFYTPPIVIKAMYKALENMGLEKGNILEPSCRSWKLYRNVTRKIKRM